MRDMKLVTYLSECVGAELVERCRSMLVQSALTAKISLAAIPSCEILDGVLARPHQSISYWELDESVTTNSFASIRGGNILNRARIR